MSEDLVKRLSFYPKPEDRLAIRGIQRLHVALFARRLGDSEMIRNALSSYYLRLNEMAGDPDGVNRGKQD